MNLSPLPIQKFFDNNGRPLVGGLLFTYEAGTSTKTATYVSSSGVTQNTNPIELDFRGECRLWIDPQRSYKFVLSPPGDTDPPSSPIWTVDNITAGPAQQDNAAVDTGSVNNIELSIPQISAPVAFTRIVFEAAHTNTGPVTITVNGGVSQDLTWQNLADLGAGEIQANGIYQAIFDGAQWQLQSPALQSTQMRTDAEISAGVTPTNYVYFEGDVLRYGYIADDSTDNTTAIQNAINVKEQLAGGPVDLPSGTARFASTITIKNGVWLCGASDGATILKYTGNSIALTNEDVFGVAPFHNNSAIESLTLTTTTSAPSVGPGTVGVKLNNAAYFNLRNVKIRGFALYGVQLHADVGKACLYIGIDGSHIFENEYGLIATGVNVGVNAINITNSSIRANRLWNIYSEQDVRSWNITGCSLEGGGTGGTGGSVFLRQPLGLNLAGCYFEQTTSTNAIEFSDVLPSSGINITGNLIQGTGTSTGIKLGTSAFVKGVTIAGNEINNWSIGINPVAVMGGTIGPNSFTSCATTVATPGLSCTGLVVHDGTSWKSYGAPVSEFAADGANWSGFPKMRYATVQLGNVAYSSVGTNTTPVAGTIYYAEVFVDRAKIITGAGFLVGSVGTNNAFIVSLYSATGALLGNSNLAGITTGGANVLSQANFTAPYTAAPGKYWIGVQLNGTTDRIKTVPNNLFIDVPLTKSVAGVFGTLPALVPPTTFTADVGPIAYVF